MDQWSEIVHNISNRSGEKLASKGVELSKAQNIFLCSANDWGVARNGGRLGSRFAPKAIINSYKNLTSPTTHDKNWNVIQNGNEKIGDDFDQYQKELIHGCQELLNAPLANKFVHIGGGHDHIYPYLKSLEKNCKKIVVFNIDAHLDTREDQLHHSGTPFRQFSNETQVDFELIQIGIHPFANSAANYNELSNGNMRTYHFDELKKMSKNFSETPNIISKYYTDDKETQYVFSLDCDAISANEMSGVSAVNHQGLPYAFVSELLKQYVQLKLKRSHLGIYEYNPIFDDLSQKGSRALALLIYTFFQK